MMQVGLFPTVWEVRLPQVLAMKEGAYVLVKKYATRDEALEYLNVVWGMPMKVAEFFMGEVDADGIYV